MTLPEFTLYLEAYNDKAKREHEEKITLSYMTAFWAAQWQSKKHPPSLEKILGKKEQKKKRMSDEEMYKQVKALHKAFGGD